MLFLEIVFNSQRKKYLLEEKKIIVGRSAECNLILNLAYISRIHFSISINKNMIEIKDLGSANGLMLNGKRNNFFTLNLNSSFFIEELEFVIKQGIVSDYNTSEEIADFINVNREQIAKNKSINGIKKTVTQQYFEEDDLNVDYIVTVNKDMIKLIKQVKKLSKTDIFVQLAGASGVGKELFARLLHENSSRNLKKYIALNCAAIPENLLELELFGHEKGSFTGAIAQRKGKLELSSGGTLFLDEIGEMHLDLQVKLLRAIQEGTFYRVGGTELVRVDLRIISATNKDLEVLVKEKMFREDLYYRLVHVNITIPPLRERKNDITPLISYFTQKSLDKIGKVIAGYSVKALNTLNEYDWPGNVRELENEVFKLVNLVDDDELIDFDLLSPKIQMFSPDLINTIKITNIKGKLGEVEKDNILSSLNKNKWNKTETSKELGISYNTLFRKLKKYKISLKGS